MTKERGRLGNKRRELLTVIGTSATLTISGCGAVGAVLPGHNPDIETAVGQMFVVGFDNNGSTPDVAIAGAIKKEHIGGVILFDKNYSMRSITRALNTNLQTIAKDSGNPPLIIATDHEGGRVSRDPFIPQVAPAQELGEAGCPESAVSAAKIIAKGLKQDGINTDFAPDADTGFGSAIRDRSFGTNAHTVSTCVEAQVQEYNSAGIISSAKHFPNHGPATVDSHLGLPTINHSMDTIVTHDLPSFKAAIKKDVPMVMLGHLVYPALDAKKPASISPKVVNLLRKDLGFDGIIITDDLNMKGVGNNPSDAAKKAVMAGVDMVIISKPADVQPAYSAVLSAVKSGEINKQQLLESAKRISDLKKKYLGEN